MNHTTEGHARNVPDLHGIYKYFWDTLKDTLFVSRYFGAADNLFREYLTQPHERAYDFVKRLSDEHQKSAPTMLSLLAMETIERSIGKLREKHKEHVVHSINVMLLGLCFVKEHPKLRKCLLFYPGEAIDLRRKQANEMHRESIFWFRWIFACLFHDTGYVLELLAKGLDPDGMGIAWEGVEQIRGAMNRVKVGVQKVLSDYVRELRNFPVIPFKNGYDNDPDTVYFPESNVRAVTEETDLLELFARYIERTNASKRGKWKDVLKELDDIFTNAFKVGVEKSFDHGKVGALMFLHELRTTYMISRNSPHRTPRLSWHRANIYYEVLDASLAIFLHNSLRFELIDVWGKYDPTSIPPLSYLLTLCDLIVEWDKQSVGHGEDIPPVDAERIDIHGVSDVKITIRYKDNSELARDVRERVASLFNPRFIEIDIKD